MRYVIILLSVLMFACNPVKRLERQKARICPLCEVNDTIIKTDSIVVFYYDTVIPVQLPQDTAYISPEEMKAIISALGTIYKPGHYLILRNTSKFIIAEAWMTEKGLAIYSRLKDTTFNVRLENALKEVIKWKNLYEHKTTTVTKEVEVPVKYVPHLYLVTFWIMVVALLCAVAYFLTKQGNNIYLWIAKQLIKLIPKKK